MLRYRARYTESLQVATARDFRGGLNTNDGDLNLNSKYSTELFNLYPDTNGRLRLRFGTSLFCDLSGVLDAIVNVTYFGNVFIVFARNGTIYSVDSLGVATVIWNTAIANALPGAPAGWSTGLTLVNFAQFQGNLICCNGIDKPLTITTAPTVSYLQDAGTGSNANVPRALFCATSQAYLVLATTPTDTTTLFIGSKGVAGTFVGDPPPNDAVNFNTASYVSRGLVDITGLSTFRDRLIVSYNEALLSIELGQYDDATTPAHIPRVDDVIDNYGAVSQRCLVPLGDDLVFLDFIGVNSIQRALVTGTLSPVRESQLVANDIQLALKAFSLTELQQEVFSVYDRLNEQIMFFIPDTTTLGPLGQHQVFVYCFDKSRRFRAMTRYSNMPYFAGCRTAENRIFLATQGALYFYHNEAEPLYSDQALPANQPWDDGTLFDDGTGWFDFGETFVGTPIPYSFATPWSELNQPARIKTSKYLRVLAEGTGSVRVEMFIDRMTTAALSLDMTQTDTPSSGELVVRPTNNEQTYAWPSTFRRAKLRVSGESSSELSFVSLTLLYNVGGFRR